MFKKYYHFHKHLLLTNRTKSGLFKGLHPICIDIISMVFCVTLFMIAFMLFVKPTSGMFMRINKSVCGAIVCLLGLVFIKGFPNIFTDCYIVYQIHKGNYKIKREN